MAEVPNDKPIGPSDLKDRRPEGRYWPDLLKARHPELKVVFDPVALKGTIASEKKLARRDFDEAFRRFYKDAERLLRGVPSTLLEDYPELRSLPNRLINIIFTRYEHAVTSASFEAHQLEVASQSILTHLKQELDVYWPLAIQLSTMQEHGEILTNFGGQYRVMGATGNEDYWVVKPDGSLSEPSYMPPNDHDRYAGLQGIKYWDVVGPHEIALKWNGGGQRSFEIAKSSDQLTPEQLRRIEEIERGLEQRGFNIGNGWGLTDRQGTPEAADPTVSDGIAKVGPELPDEGDASEAQLTELLKKFGRR